MTVSIGSASSPDDYRAFEGLIREYLAWLRGRYRDDGWFVTEVLDRQSIDDEIRNLSTVYGPPNGNAFVAMDGGDALGCGAYRRLDDTTCEMKRVFVPERHPGKGLGRRLCEAVLAAARDDGYASIKLDSGTRMSEAAALYETLGFRPCPPYHRYPDALMPYFVFMELRLRPTSGRAGDDPRGDDR